MKIVLTLAETRRLIAKQLGHAGADVRFIQKYADGSGESEIDEYYIDRVEVAISDPD